ncbi:MAG: flagellar hook assembly protein FlgD [Candidatus Acidiferrales bacterium]
MASIGTVIPLVAQAIHAFDHVNQAATSGNSGASGTSDSSNPPPSNQLTGDSFIQLLSAQLQSQDPLNPVDPTTFVTQLVQFNQLEQLIDINGTLSGAASAAGGATDTPTANARMTQNFNALLGHSNPAGGL